MTANNLVVLGTHPDSLMWFDPVAHAYDEVWGMAHHDNIIEKSTRCFEAHSPEIVWEHGGNQHVNRLKWIANNMPLYTAYQWPMKLGPNHIYMPNDEMARTGDVRLRAEDWNNDGTPINETPYVESSIGYILAFGLYNRGNWDNLYLYGINMDGSDEYTYQRPNIAYFIGKYEGRGTKVHLPPKCGLLNSQWTGRVYGHPKNINDITYHLKPTSPRWMDMNDD